MLSLRQLEMVAALSPAWALRAGCQGSGISQPALSQAIRAIEARSARSFSTAGRAFSRPTMFGPSCSTTGKAVLRDMEALRREIALAKPWTLAGFTVSASIFSVRVSGRHMP